MSSAQEEGGQGQEKVFSLYVDRLIAKKNAYNECKLLLCQIRSSQEHFNPILFYVSDHKTNRRAKGS